MALILFAAIIQCDMYCTSNPRFSAFPASPLDQWRFRIIKRGLDILVASLALLLFVPVWVVVSLAIGLESVLTGQQGGIFYGQERITRGGHSFLMYKFRTMKPTAESSSGPVWACRDDQRTTRVGQFLRRASLDELPQLWNILKGEMSFVGPRPERPFFVDRFSQEIPRYNQRHAVKTGLTGWAQIHGLRGDTSLEQRVAYDLYYIEHWSLKLDLYIIWCSFAVVFKDFYSHRAY